MSRWIANHLPRSIQYWLVIRVWAHLTVVEFRNRTPEEVTVFDALKYLHDD